MKFPATRQAAACGPESQRCTTPARRRPVLFAALLMGLALAFNAYFTLLTLEGIYADETLSRAQIIGDSLRRDLQREVRFQADLSGLGKIGERLTEARTSLRRTLVGDGQKLPAADQNTMAEIRVTLTTADGAVIESLPSGNPPTERAEILQRARAVLDGNDPHGSDTTDFESAGVHYIVLPVRTLQGRWIGALIVELAPSLVAREGRRFVDEIQGVLALTVVAALAFLSYLFAWQGGLVSARQATAHKQVTALVFIVLLLAQLLSSALAIAAFRHGFYGASVATAETELAVLRDELKPVLELGIDIKHLADLEPRLQAILGNQSVLGEISVTTLDHKVVAVAQREPGQTKRKVSLSALLSGLWTSTTPRKAVPVYTMVYAHDRPRAILTAWLAQDALDGRIWDIAVQGLTLLVVGMLLARELLVLARRYITRPPRSAVSGSSSVALSIRPAIFFFMFGIDLSMSFVPLQMKRLYQPIAGLPEEFMLGLPISAEFLCVGIALLGAGLWSDRRGWSEPFFAGLVAASLGAAYSGLAPGPFHFVVARGLVGIGYGLTFMAAQSVVIRSTRNNGRTAGLAHLFAGLYAGSLSGGTIGAMLADHISFEEVFLLGAGLIALIALHTLGFMRRTFVRSPIRIETSARGSAIRALPRLLADRNFLCVMLFSSLPAAIAVVGLINYFSPLYLNGMGASQTTIGQVMLIYGLCLAVAGPWAGQLADTISDKRIPVYLGASLGAVSLMSFALFDGLGAALAAMVLLGLSSCFVLPSQSAYVLSLPTSRALGDGMTLGIFRATSRIGQMLGPAVFAIFVSLSDARSGIAYLGLGYAIVAVAFVVLSRPSHESDPTPAFSGPPSRPDPAVA